MADSSRSDGGRTRGELLDAIEQAARGSHGRGFRAAVSAEVFAETLACNEPMSRIALEELLGAVDRIVARQQDAVLAAAEAAVKA